MKSAKTGWGSEMARLRVLSESECEGEPSYVPDDRLSWLAVCPACRSSKHYQPAFPGPYGHVYRPPEALDGTTPNPWYTRPHVIRRGILRFLKKGRRNVLYGDGSVRTFTDEEFQELGLPEEAWYEPPEGRNKDATSRQAEPQAIP